MTGRRTSTRRESTPDEGTLAGDVDSTSGPMPSREEIAEEAYRRYLERGGQDGQDFDDWLEAERSLRSRQR